jgi:hypothetical protein
MPREPHSFHAFDYCLFLSRWEETAPLSLTDASPGIWRYSMICVLIAFHRHFDEYFDTRHFTARRISASTTTHVSSSLTGSLPAVAYLPNALGSII